MNRITAILKPHADGTLHLPLPPELRRGEIEVTATLRPAGERPELPVATPETLSRRNAALDGLRELGGLTSAIPDPAAWQREVRADRPLPGRD